MAATKRDLLGGRAGARLGRLLLALCVLGLIGADCDEEEWKYLLSQAPGQAELLLHRESFARLLRDPKLDPAVRAKLEFVLDVKRYGVEQIGLLRNRNYEVYVKIDREAVSWNLTACDPVSFNTLTWDFPVVGKLPYLGFFSKEDADKMAAKLKAQGYDVYLRTAGAYSMLGLVADPLYSPLVKMRDEDLANLVIHEMTHSTVWIKGYPEFNENLALFVGNQGSYNYLVKRYGADSTQAAYALGSNEDDKLFADEVMKLYRELDAMYRSDLTREQKLERKAAIIAEHQRRFREEVMPTMHTDQYQGWPDKAINNATIISRTTYYHDLKLYEDLYRAKSEDLRALLDFFKELAEKPGLDPEAFAREWLKTRG